jgi:hypothetical protein
VRLRRGSVALRWQAPWDLAWRVGGVGTALVIAFGLQRFAERIDAEVAVLLFVPPNRGGRESAPASSGERRRRHAG